MDSINMNASTPSFGMALKLDKAMTKPMKQLSAAKLEAANDAFNRIHNISNKYNCDVILVPTKKSKKFLAQVLSNADPELPPIKKGFPYKIFGGWRHDSVEKFVKRGSHEQFAKNASIKNFDSFTVSKG